MLTYSKLKQTSSHQKFTPSSLSSKEYFINESYSSNKYNNSFKYYSNKKKHLPNKQYANFPKPKYKHFSSFPSESISIDYSNKENQKSIENMPSFEKKMSMDKTETSTSSKSHGDSFDNNEDIILDISDKKEEHNVKEINVNKTILNKFDMIQGNNYNCLSVSNCKTKNVLDFNAPAFLPCSNNNTHISHNYLKKAQNTEILSVNVKISRDKVIVFKLRRFDDLFQTVKLFCEIHQIKEELIKPIIIKALEAMNSVYKIMNCKMGKDDIEMLEKMKNIMERNKMEKKENLV